MPESRLRLCLVLAGLPEPGLNLGIASGLVILGKVDLLYAEYKVAIEYEGDQHRERHQWDIDIDRYDDFRGEGYRVIRVTAWRMRRPRQVVRTVCEAIRAGGYPGPEPVFTDDWQRLFPTAS